MDTISMAAGAVTGARHLRASRNGQDAVATYRGVGGAVIVVADGCGSAGSSEVGARLGATLFAAAVGARLARTECEIDVPAAWAGARGDVVESLAALAGSSQALIHDCFLFTLVAAAIDPRGGASVWALGDGAYSFGDSTHVLGPFEDIQPPYLGYDLFGEPRRAHFVSAPRGCETMIVATDGACDLDAGLEAFATAKNFEHPDALRRQLALLARSDERIDWEARRVVRSPARLQDDCAVAVLRRRLPS
jgi:hypothetical protein